jgi:hypothetical protein
MRERWISAALVAGLALAAAGPLAAQHRQLQPSIMDEEEDDQPAAPPPQVNPARRSHTQKTAPAVQIDPGLNAGDQRASHPKPTAVAEPAPVKPAHHARTQAAAPAPRIDPGLKAAHQVAPSQKAQPIATAVAEPPVNPARRSRTQTATPALRIDPDLDADDQLAPSQMTQTMPAAVAEPTQVNPARRARAQSAAPALQTDPDLDADDQLAPSQLTQPMPGAVAEPTAAPNRKTMHQTVHAAVDAPPEPSAAARPSQPAASHTVACSGPFAADSGNLSLAMAFDSRNVVFTEVDGGPIGKVPASVLFPKDPKRRLEVWWSDAASRTRINLIVINGKSGWSAPRGLRLGLTLPEMERLNHKPFKLKGFDKNNVASVSDWDGGALADLPGGCKAGVNLHADPKASAEAQAALSADHEFSSADAAWRAAKPTISEILIGY